MELRLQIRQFITSNFYLSEPERLADTDSLLDTGVVDSTGVLELVAYLEKQFAIAFQNRDMVPENLDSVESIIRFIERKRQSG